jgi:hypothetical protein
MSIVNSLNLTCVAMREAVSYMNILGVQTCNKVTAKPALSLNEYASSEVNLLELHGIYVIELQV